MAKSLLIVESPAKAKTLKKFLGRDFRVEATLGHVKDLPKRSLGVDIERGFEPQYEIIKGKAKVLTAIKKAAQGRDRIYLAPDPDREGEAIAWHVAEELGATGKKKHKKGPLIQRVLVNEITKRGVQEAVSNPSDLNLAKYQAQQARRILDRLVGYRLSPLLWKKVRRGLSAGRVQSVAVLIICNREKEIQAFKIEEYWSIEARLEGEKPPPFAATLAKIDGRKVEIRNREEAERVASTVRGATLAVASIEKKQRRKYPSPPFITSTLQQEAYRKLRFPARKTMSLAQKLYEGIDFGQEGSEGLITYMRTDSVRVSADAQQEARRWIEASYGAAELPPRPPTYRSRKLAQEAHEAIRPTDFDRAPDKVARYLKKDEAALYDLIWKRFIASQMQPAVYDQTLVDIEGGGCTFRATGSVLRKKGFTSVYTEGGDEEAEAKGEGGILPLLREGERLRIVEVRPEQHFTKPPPRYTEATLIKELERDGIGRPSTYASILGTILDKSYVLKEDGRFLPTELGLLVTDLLSANFPNIVNVEFTAQMEDSLDRIEEGRQDWSRTLAQFYRSFSERLDKAKLEMRNVKVEAKPTDIDCDRCGSKMVIRWGKNGEFLACSTYPKCKSTMDFARDSSGKPVAKRNEESGKSCEKCGSAMVVKRGRFGEFLACSAYPECRNTRTLSRGPAGEVNESEIEKSDKDCEKCGGAMVLKLNRYGNKFYGCENYPKCKNAKPLGTGVSCPEDGCEGEIVQRSTKRRRVFYGCSRYPDCAFVIWDRPVKAKCPSCEFPILVEKYSKKSGPAVQCPNKECGYRRPVKGEEPKEAVRP